MFSWDIKQIISFAILLSWATSTCCDDRHPESDHALLDFKGQSSGIRHPCPWTSIVTISGSRDLGSEMWEYASVYSVARYTGLDPFIPPILRIKLSRIFKNLQIPSFEHTVDCNFTYTTFVNSFSDWENMSQSIHLPMKSIQIDLIIKYIDDIVQQFVLRDKLISGAKRVLRRAFTHLNITATDTLVGIHIDLEDFQLNADDLMAYYIRAMQSFQIKFQNAASFLVLCGENSKCNQQFEAYPNVYVETTDNVPVVQLAILTICDHVILGHDSIGVWGAILAEGETMFKTQTAVTFKLMQNLAKWHTFID